MAHHNEMNFTTKDSDNDKCSGSNCALLYGPTKSSGGWWYKSCWQVNLNNYYNHNIYLNNRWIGKPPILTEMKIRPHNCNI